MAEYPKHLYRVFPLRSVPTLETITVHSPEQEALKTSREGYCADLSKANALLASLGPEAVSVTHWYDLRKKLDDLLAEHEALKAEYGATKARTEALEAENHALKADAPKPEPIFHENAFVYTYPALGTEIDAQQPEPAVPQSESKVEPVVEKGEI